MASSKGLVLVTGVNGYIGQQTAKYFLESGYSVRGTARSLKSTQGLAKVLKTYVDSGQLTFTEVPDITVPGAFDDAVKGADAIIHLASPVTFSAYDGGPLIKAAREGTRTLLASAQKHAGLQLKTILLVASIGSIGGSKAPGDLHTEEDWNPRDPDNLTPEIVGPFLYAVSKKAGEQAFWAFRDQEKPSFAMTAVHPSFVVGPYVAPPEDPATLGDAIRHIYDVLAGKDPMFDLSFQYVHIDDTTRFFRWCVEHTKVADGERYLVTSMEAGNAQAIADVLRNHYPERRDVIKEGTPGQGYGKGFVVTTDTMLAFGNEKASKAAGITRWIGFERCILDTAKTFERYL